MRISLIALFVGLSGSVVMLQLGAAPLIRGLLFIPFFAAAFGSLQALHRTCSYAARNGLRITDLGEETIANPAEIDRLRRQGRKVVLTSLLTALTATLTVVFLP